MKNACKNEPTWEGARQVARQAGSWLLGHRLLSRHRRWLCSVWRWQQQAARVDMHLPRRECRCSSAQVGLAPRAALRRRRPELFGKDGRFRQGTDPWRWRRWRLRQRWHDGGQRWQMIFSYLHHTEGFGTPDEVIQERRSLGGLLLPTLVESRHNHTSHHHAIPSPSFIPQMLSYG